MKKLTIRHGHVASEDGILDAADLVQALGSDTYKQWILKHVVNSRAGLIMMKFKDVDFTPSGPPVYAQVQWGRWVANCECGGQENVSKEEPFFFCMSCFNGSNTPDHKDRHAVRPVIFPAETETIETLLMERDTDKRHWLAEETVEDLVTQNAVLVEEKRLLEEQAEVEAGV